MAYNSVYPQMYYQPQSATGGIIWVQGEAGAKSYLVAPNNTVVLFDSENDCIYLKSADASGMPSIKVLDYKIRENPRHSGLNQPTEQNSYITKDEFDAFKTDIINRIKKMNREGEDAELPL